MKVRQMNQLLLGLVAISFLNVSCQGNLQTSSSLKGSLDSHAAESVEDLNSRVDMKAVESSVAESQKTMNEARAILDQFSNKDGSIKLWSLLTSSSSGDVQSQSIFFIYEKLSQTLDKVVQKVALAKAKLSESRVLLAAEASKLDPSNPAHQLVLTQITAMMAQIDRAESMFSTGLGQLAGQLDLVNRGIDMLTMSAGSLFPGANIIVGVLTNQVKMAITEFQGKLRAI